MKRTNTHALAAAGLVPNVILTLGLAGSSIMNIVGSNLGSISDFSRCLFTDYAPIAADTSNQVNHPTLNKRETKPIAASISKITTILPTGSLLTILESIVLLLGLKFQFCMFITECLHPPTASEATRFAACFTHTGTY
jgi:hypothetical protein